MSRDPEEARVRAEARFGKLHEAERAAEAARVEREGQSHAVEAKTARLKALRLAKAAADKQAAMAAPKRARKG